MKLAVFLVFISLAAHAQLTLRGRVVNGVDGQPVPFCSVFLANTTKGTTADEHGQFVLTNLPAGRFDLVVSSVGFETLAAPMGTDQAAPLLIKLSPNTNQLAEVQVRAHRDPDWLANLAEFKKLFIGTSRNAQQCELVNANALWFDKDAATGRLVGGAREPLVIENNALGYRINYALTQFVYDATHHYVSYLGYPIYTPLAPRNRRQATRWQKARQEAYLGSSMHFMRALHSRQADEAGFEVRRVLERSDSSNVGGIWRVRKLRLLVRDKLPGTFLINDDASTDSLMVLAFDTPIQITYTREREAAEYVRSLFGDAASATGPQTSLIYLTKPTVTVEKNGNFYEPLGLVFEGYWGWEKVADLLPLTYEP